ncbi:MAG: hypothetical protein AMXMBFR33_35870 [Candidatus Xenobia bacterium]
MSHFQTIHDWINQMVSDAKTGKRAPAETATLLRRMALQAQCVADHGLGAADELMEWLKSGCPRNLPAPSTLQMPAFIPCRPPAG